MRVIYKYPLPSAINSVALNANAEILCVQLQENVITMWALVDTDNPIINRTFAVYGTGNEIESFSKYVGTVQQNQFVWHVFELENNE